MAGRWNLLILALYLSLVVVLSNQSCEEGYIGAEPKCTDYDECAVDEDYPDKVGPCGENATCHNTNGSFYCQCADGFRSTKGDLHFSAGTSATCKDINECTEDEDICGPNAECFNTIPHYSCICADGFISTTGKESFRRGDNITCRDIDECQEQNLCGQNAACINRLGSFHCVCNAGFGLKSGRSSFSGSQEQCEDICVIDKTICGNGTCHRGASGHYCACHAGFTNYGNKGSRCTALNCDVFKPMNNLQEKFLAAHDLMMQLEKSCLNLTESENPTELDGEDMLMRLLSVTDELLSSGAFNDNRKVSTFLNLVENTLRLIGAFIKPPGTTRSSTHTELELLVKKGVDLPKGAVTLSSKQAQLDIQLETAAGDPSYYPGFTTVSMLSYANLEDSANGFFGGMKPQVNQSFELNSKVVTVSVSNRNTSHLKEPVKLTFYHLKQTNESNPTCVFWDASEEGGSWSPRGCKVVESKPEYTVCSCNHLSSFAVLMALYDIEETFELQLITWVGLSLSLICLFLCILTFSLIRSIKSPRTTIHLHLCISLFIATVIFLAGISRTESRVGCAVVAGLLHFFFLAAFCWMCLEGIQLFRMVVLVFNTNFKTLYMMAGGYGVPAVIVAFSAIANARGYGTKRHCWLNLELIWGFFGPACIIIIVNVFFFLITVWKLAQKFSSLNPDLDNLHKIKAFTITAMAQLTLLGTTWVFGCFQFEEGTIIMSYLFTIFASFQGVMIFVMHCLFSKQVGRAPVKNKSTSFATFFSCVKTQLLFLYLGERRIWIHPVQMLCSLEEELLKLQLLALQQSSSLLQHLISPTHTYTHTQIKQTALLRATLSLFLTRLFQSLSLSLSLFLIRLFQSLSFCYCFSSIMPGGSQKKTCPNCGEKICCRLKMCIFCKHPQPQHVRLQKKLDKFKSQQKQWLASMKKNKLRSHVLDDAAILIEKLYALGMKPLLLIANPPKGVTRTYQTKIMLPMDAQLSTSAKTCLENVDAIYKLMLEGWTRLNPDQLPRENEEVFILNLVPCGSAIQAPAHQAPAHQAPAHQAPAHQAPTHQEPAHQAPAHQAPAVQPPLWGPQQHKRQKKIKDCPHNQLETFPVRKIIKTRKRKGRTEHLYDWQPCTMCGKTWPPSWQPA